MSAHALGIPAAKGTAKALGRRRGSAAGSPTRPDSAAQGQIYPRQFYPQLGMPLHQQHRSVVLTLEAVCLFDQQPSALDQAGALSRQHFADLIIP